MIAMAFALAVGSATGAEPPAIRVPAGFTAEVWVQGLPNARTLALGEGGTLFVGTREAGKVYALPQAAGPLAPGAARVIASGMTMPNGLALLRGDLYVAENAKIWRYPQVEAQLAAAPGAEPRRELVRGDLPTEGHHGWRYIAFGPDERLYVALGAPCNVCVAAPIERGGDRVEYASIISMKPDGSDWRTEARGVRNSVGLAWHPQTRELWFTDNGRDLLGDDVPPCELNRAPAAGLHFGFPACHGNGLADPQFGGAGACAGKVAPVQELGAHVAPLGLRFYTGTQFPQAYRNQLFIAEHGSWNRSRKSGYRVTLVRLDAAGRAIAYEPFAEGWLADERASGRPADLLVTPDGSLLVSDDSGGRIWRIRHAGPAAAAPPRLP